MAIANLSQPQTHSRSWTFRYHPLYLICWMATLNHRPRISISIEAVLYAMSPRSSMPVCLLNYQKHIFKSYSSETNRPCLCKEMVLSLSHKYHAFHPSNHRSKLLPKHHLHCHPRTRTHKQLPHQRTDATRNPNIVFLALYSTIDEIGRG